MFHTTAIRCQKGFLLVAFARLRHGDFLAAGAQYTIAVVAGGGFASLTNLTQKMALQIRQS